MVRIRLLGAVGAVTDGGEPVDVGPAKCQAVLAALALSAGTAVPVWRLVDLVWGADAPRTAERTLASYVTRLRQSLGAGSIVRVGAAYRLDVAAEVVDALRFQRRIDSGDVAAALAEWTGYPLAGLAAAGLAPTVDGLVERWLAAVEADLAARVQTDPAAVIGPLTELTATHPFREGLWALLMTALYRLGRQADALAAYRRARQNLVERLGVEPGPRLRELESLVLGQDEWLAGHRAPERIGLSRPGNLPGRLGRLMGREEELGVIEDALAAYPVVTLVGPGGIGKTRLAIAAAQRAGAQPAAGRQDAFDDGAWLIDLTEIASSGDVPRAVAGVLDIIEGSAQVLDRAIVTALRSRRVLLVLDNCEHVIEGAARLAQAIAETCPGVRVLATSRAGLGLAHGHERLVAVAPLAIGPGVELFNERASAISGAFDARTSRPDVEEICRRLDGVPLAIELAAARTTSMTTVDLRERLDDQLRLLVAGRRTDAQRHRTIRATIQWSYDLLGPPERVLLQRLSVFAGPFDRAAAAAVAAVAAVAGEPAQAGEHDLDDLLGELVDRSMLVVQPGPAGQRFRLLETVRQFAAEHLAGTGQAALVTERHARWCLDRVGRIGRQLAGPDEVDGAARLDELWPNLRAAVDWACATNDRRLAYRLIRPIVAEIALRSRTELGDWVERVLAMTPADDRELVVFGLRWAAQRYKLGQNPGGYERVVDRYGEPDHPLIHHARASVYGDYAALGTWAAPSLAALRRRGEDDLAELVEVDIGASLLFCGQLEEGDAVLAKLADRYRGQGPPTLLNWSLMLLSYSALTRGGQDRAERLLDEAISVQIPQRTHSPNKAAEARAVFRRGDRALAVRMLRGHVDHLLDTENMQGACVAAIEFVNMMAQLDRLPEAARMLDYLEATGLLDASFWAVQVAEARTAVHAAAPRTLSGGPDMDDRRSLEYMRGVLGELG